MKRKPLNVFSLSFLDCITCGLGAVILLFVIINAKSAAHKDKITSDLRAEALLLEMEVTAEKKKMIALRNAFSRTSEDLVVTRGLSRQVLEILSRKKKELAESSNQTLSQKSHVNKLKSDIKVLEAELRRLKAAAKTDDSEGTKLRPFPGTGDRQYLTDLKMGGRRILILVDASASMLDETILGAIRRRNLNPEERRTAPKWRQCVATVEWLIAQLPSTSQFQVYAFNEAATPLIPGTRGRWLDASDTERLDEAVKGMRALAPEKGTSLHSAFETVKTMQPAPDNIFLLVDGLPTMAAGKPWRKRVSSEKRLRLYKEAVGRLTARVPVNIILYPMEGDPMAADAYWRLAKKTRGSFFCPSKDWP
jgi:hypothetical protein